MTTSHEGRRLSGIDSAFLYLERKEIPLHIAAVCIFDGPISFPEFVAAIDSKLHLIPRYRQIVVDPPFHMGYPSWDDDANFSIKRHILRARLEEPGDDAQLEKLASEILSRVMDRSRPLWDIHVVDGLAGGKGALIVRIHHALADGISGISLMKVMLDATPAGSRASVKPPTSAPARPVHRLYRINSRQHASCLSREHRRGRSHPPGPDPGTG